MSDLKINTHETHRDDSTDNFAGDCSEMFSGALAGEIGVDNAIIIRKLEVLDDDPLMSTTMPTCIPDNVPNRVLYNYFWKPLNSRLMKELFYFSAESLITHLRHLCEEHYLFCKNVKGVTWYSVNYKRLNRLYEISKYTN